MALLVKNVQILGSDQKLPDRLDIFVSGEKIAALGRFPDKKADQIIDGQGCYLSAGFIDVDNDSDHYLSIFTNPGQADFLKQGITTIVGGTCGASLAPLLYGSLESIEGWADTREINVDWHTTKEFLKVLAKKPLGVNFATLIGHATMRQAIVGEKSRNLTKNELVVMSEVLKRALGEGGFGLSTGLGYVQSKDTPYSELRTLANIVREYSGIYATHLRKTKKGLISSVDETIKLAKDTGVKTLISHLIPLVGEEKEYEEALGEIENLPTDLDFHFDIYPFDTSILTLYTFLPSWAQKDDIKIMNMALKDKWLSSKILKDLPEVKPNDFTVAKAPSNNSLVGYTLGDLKRLYSLKTYKDALIKLMTTTNLQATIFYKNINKNLIKNALFSSRSLIATNAASFKEEDEKTVILRPERAVSTFPKFLSLVLEEKIISLNDAIRKLTSIPAQKFNFRNRGQVIEGYFADLVGFKNGDIKFVIVNGKVAVENGQLKETKAGKILHHQI